MVQISCSTKFHAFNLAEELERQGLLGGFWTSFAHQKNTWASKWVSRTDREQIPPEKINTCLPLALAIKLWPRPEWWNAYFDQWVAASLPQKSADFRVFIGWSGMSEHSLKKAKKRGCLAIVERGSSHIVYQNRLLQEEYSRFGLKFQVHPEVIRKELAEYALADYISVPSAFVRDSFVEQGIPASKLIQNPYGAGMELFTAAKNPNFNIRDGKFIVLYLGRLSIRKGLIYHFRALEQIQAQYPQLEPWFIGSVEPAFEETVARYRAQNPHWRFWGHVPQSNLPQYLKDCAVAVQPSLEEGLSMVIPQLLSSGIPVIATSHTGGGDVIDDGKTGYIVPIRQPEAIAEKLAFLIGHPAAYTAMRKCLNDQTFQYSWERYGQRWKQALEKLGVLTT